MRLGVFGGTFNPVHFGHLRAAEEVRGRLSLGGVIFVPSASPPLKSGDLAEIEQRFLMTSMAVAANEYFSISDIECRRPGRSYTVETARALAREHPEAELVFIIGADSFLDLPDWRGPEELVGLFSFAIVPRAPVGFKQLGASPFINVPAADLEALDRGERESIESPLLGGRKAYLLGIPALSISSTAIRALIRDGRSIKYLLPERVESFIMSNGLYT